MELPRDVLPFKPRRRVFLRFVLGDHRLVCNPAQHAEPYHGATFCNTMRHIATHGRRVPSNLSINRAVACRRPNAVRSTTLNRAAVRRRHTYWRLCCARPCPRAIGSAGSQRTVAHVCLRRSRLVAVAPQVLVPLPTSREVDRQDSQVPGTHKGVCC